MSALLLTFDVTVDNALSCFENGGAEVWCCDEGYTYEVTTTTVNAQLLAYQDAAKEFASLSTEECLVYDFLGGTSGTYLGGGGLKKRSMNYTEERSTSALQPRQFGNIGIGTVSALISLIYDLLTNILNGQLFFYLSSSYIPLFGASTALISTTKRVWADKMNQGTLF